MRAADYNRTKRLVLLAFFGFDRSRDLSTKSAEAIGPAGRFVPDPPLLIAGHQTLGHAHENMMTGNPEERTVRQFENQMRKELGSSLRRE